MNEISAAMGLTNLESMDEFISINRENYRLYQNQLSNIEGVSIVNYAETEKYNYQYVVLDINSQITGLTRDELVTILHAENVLARRYFHPGCHQMEPYRSYFPHAGLLLPHTEQLSKRVLCLPTGTAVGEFEIKQICDLIHLALDGHEEIKLKLPTKPR